MWKLFVLLATLAVALQAKEEGEKEDLGTVIGIDLGTTYSWYVLLKRVSSFLIESKVPIFQKP